MWVLIDLKLFKMRALHKFYLILMMLDGSSSIKKKEGWSTPLSLIYSLLYHMHNSNSKTESPRIYHETVILILLI